MAQASNQINPNVQPSRSFSPIHVLPLILAVALLAANFLPQTSSPVEGIQTPNIQMLVLSVIAVGLAVWTLYDIRGRFISSLLGFGIGIVAILSLFNFVAQLTTTVSNDGSIAHVGIGFWIALIAAAGLVLQLFLPRPAVAGVYGEEGLRDFMARMGILGELLGFLWKRKLYWLIPMVLTLMVFIVLIAASTNSALAPFIYTLF